jgi:hypothetical protein
MSDQAKVSVSLQLDHLLVKRLANAIKHLPPGWDLTRMFEAGAEELLEKLARKYNQGKPFPP